MIVQYFLHIEITEVTSVGHMLYEDLLMPVEQCRVTSVLAKPPAHLALRVVLIQMNGRKLQYVICPKHEFAIELVLGAFESMLG